MVTLKPGESVGLETCESLLYKKMYDKFSIQFNNMQIIVAKVSAELFLTKFTKFWSKDQRFIFFSLKKTVV